VHLKERGAQVHTAATVILVTVMPVTVVTVTIARVVVLRVTAVLERSAVYAHVVGLSRWPSVLTNAISGASQQQSLMEYCTTALVFLHVH
jgi:hypothetical protein